MVLGVLGWWGRGEVVVVGWCVGLGVMEVRWNEGKVLYWEEEGSTERGQRSLLR